MSEDPQESVFNVTPEPEAPREPNVTYRTPPIHDGDIRRTVEFAERIRKKFVQEYSHQKYPLLAAALGQCFGVVVQLVQSNGVALKVSQGGITWSRKEEPTNGAH